MSKWQVKNWNIYLWYSWSWGRVHVTPRLAALILANARRKNGVISFPALAFWSCDKLFLYWAMQQVQHNSAYQARMRWWKPLPSHSTFPLVESQATLLSLKMLVPNAPSRCALTCMQFFPINEHKYSSTQNSNPSQPPPSIHICFKWSKSQKKSLKQQQNQTYPDVGHFSQLYAQIWQW